MAQQLQVLPHPPSAPEEQQVPRPKATDVMLPLDAQLPVASELGPRMLGLMWSPEAPERQVLPGPESVPLLQAPWLLAQQTFLVL
jgi:hypothetical protein